MTPSVPVAPSTPALPLSRVSRCVLDYTVGSSYKQYALWLEPDLARSAPTPHYFVCAEFGRIGTSQNRHQHTPASVDGGEAEVVYYSVLLDKLGKGYSPRTRLSIGATGETLRRLMTGLGRTRGDMAARMIPLLSEEQRAAMTTTDVVDFLQSASPKLREAALQLLPHVSTTDAKPARFRRKKTSSR
jgi:hypothetical protein